MALAVLVAGCGSDPVTVADLTQPNPDDCGAPDTGCVACNPGVGDSCSPQCVGGAGAQPGDRCVVYLRGNPETDTRVECTPVTVDGERGCCLDYSFITFGEWDGDARIGFFACMGDA